MKRRSFLKHTAVTFSAAALSLNGWIPAQSGSGFANSRMKLSFKPFNLQLKHVFTLANSSRTTTPVMLTRIDFEGYTGYGEASMPPYLGETQETASKFLSRVQLDQFPSPFLIEDILHYVDHLEHGNPAAKAAIDIALHDLTGKMMSQPWYRIWGLNPDKTPHTSFTIGIDEPDVVMKKVEEASPYKILKVKMGRDNDKEMINSIRKVSNVPLCVDVNQGWKDKHHALDMIHWLKSQGVVFVEQPLAVDRFDDLAWLMQQSPLPVIGDEAVQRLSDIERCVGLYHGINIKLMKCTGMSEAYKMATLALSKGMTVMLGCMTETSCAVSAAAQLSPLAEFADLDGNLLISNDPFKGVTIDNGKITLTDQPGIGIGVIEQIL